VMLETGQPLHAYDLDLLEGERIVVREAIDGEPLTTLDGRRHMLHPNHLVICDAQKPIGVAGVMGGSETEVSAATTRCLLEAAHFVNTSVRRTRKQLGLQTEASYRFERHVDPEVTVSALNRFAELLEEATVRRPVGGVIDVYPAPFIGRSVHLRMDNADRLLGMTVEPEAAVGYLEKLGFEVTPVGPRKFDLVAPTWRLDIQREEDVIEEIGRVHGYQHIPELLPIGSTPLGGTHGLDRLTDLFTEAALRNGLDETVSHTLGDVHPLDAATEHVQVREPHSPEMARLRNSLLPNLAIAARRNGGKDFALFEVGHVFDPEVETRSFAVLASGARGKASWRPTNTNPTDFYALKGLLEDILAAGGFQVTLEASHRDERFHPFRQADVVVDKQVVGVIGQLHPDVAEASDMPDVTVAFELDLDKIGESGTSRSDFRTVTRNPAVRRDVSVALSTKQPFAVVAKTINDARIDLLEKWWLFDRYVGPGLDTGTHSLSFGLSVRKAGANLTDEEANQVRDRFVSVLESLGAKLR
ncbi:MAG: phenylalanine--tRNA ligase subunit beta, partial [Armatimonadota bacterium]